MTKTLKHRIGFKKILAIITAAVICIALVACSKAPGNEPAKTDKPTDVPAATDAATQAPVVTDAPTEKPTDAPTAEPTEKPDPTANPYEGMPEPYFDLAFRKDEVYDALGNNDMEMEDGEVGEFTVNLDGKEVKVTGYRGTDDDDYMFILLDEYASDFPGFVEDGVTYEIFLQIDEIPAAGGGMRISNGTGGGTTMAIRGSQGQLNFNVGSTGQDGTYPGSGYIYAQTNDASQGTKIEAGKLVHVLGMYDAVNGMVRLYYNGELASEGEFGTGNFNMAGTHSGKLGIGINASFQTERLANVTAFTIVKARVYRQALTAEEVAAVYQNCVKAVTPAE